MENDNKLGNQEVPSEASKWTRVIPSVGPSILKFQLGKIYVGTVEFSLSKRGAYVSYVNLPHVKDLPYCSSEDEAKKLVETIVESWMALAGVIRKD